MSCYNYLLQVNVFSVSLVVLLAMLWHLINCSIVIIITNDFLFVMLISGRITRVMRVCCS